MLEELTQMALIAAVALLAGGLVAEFLNAALSLGG